MSVEKFRVCFDITVPVEESVQWRHLQEELESYFDSYYADGIIVSEGTITTLEWKNSSCLGAVAKLSLFCFLVPIFVYYKDMEINDLFTIRLNSEQHALLNECLSGVASLDLPPSHEDAFDSLWESVIEAEHELKFEDWIALELKNPADCGQLFNWTRDIITQSFHDIIIWDLEQFWEFQEFVRV